MAIDNTLQNASALPAHVVKTSVGTTWQAFAIKPSSKTGKITVFATDACFVATAADGAVDAGPVGANKITLTADQAAAGYSLELVGGPGRAASISVAHASGTVDVTVVQE